MSISLEEALAHGRGEERAFNCPAHDDQNASASVNVTKGVWYCYACNAHGAIDKKAPSVDEVVALLAGKADPPRILPETWLDLFDSAGPSPYWAKRFGEETASAFRCGTHYYSGLPTYPIRAVSGDVLGVVTRQDVDPKYLYPRGVRISGTLFGDYKHVPVVVVVEGAADVMALAQAGIPDHWTVLGCFGAGLKAPQVTLVADLAPKVVIAAFDGDRAGQAANERALSQLQGIAPVLSHHWNTFGGGDPGEIPVEQRIASLRETLSDSPYQKHR